ncbi:MAG: hypothetical protein HY908_11260 [Myxococcales bacterium]|nr:hypothetical protein [Myxococcales bacterium]
MKGRAPSEATLDVLTAHVSHETARGAKMYNFNFGGIKGTGPSGLGARCRTTEYLGEAPTRVTDQFRAYRDIDEGARDYLQFLGGRFGGALEAAERGDTHAFATALKARGYFTAPLTGYARSLEGLVALHVGAGQEGGPSPPSLPTSLEIARARVVDHRVESGPVDLEDLPTDAAVARMLDVVGTMTARVAAPRAAEQDER